MVSLQISALEPFLDFVLHFLRQVSLFYLALGFRLLNFDSKSEAFLDKDSMTKWFLHVDCQKRFLMYQANSMYQVADLGRGSASDKDLERLPADWERGIIFHCKIDSTSWKFLESFV